MARRPWLERVADELARQRVPRRLRVRLLGELRDHIHDLTEEGSHMATETVLDERLGDPGDLAAGARRSQAPKERRIFF